jgi:diadenylate cyclase
LHDGAVIVQKGRIAAAACFLPLTTNPALSRTLGTRHRAAIGITEETDCLSIVISEESGRISVASFGELTQGLSVPDVEKRINLHFDVGQPAITRTDEFVAGSPVALGTDAEPGDGRPAEKAIRP